MKPVCSPGPWHPALLGSEPTQELNLQCHVSPPQFPMNGILPRKIVQCFFETRHILTERQGTSLPQGPVLPGTFAWRALWLFIHPSILAILGTKETARAVTFFVVLAPSLPSHLCSTAHHRRTLSSQHTVTTIS